MTSEASPSSTGKDLPTISVVVNTCDRSGPLRVLLHALRHQTYRHFEVVVVVGPTHDDTLEMLEQDFAGRLQVERCAEFNLSVSRNVGLRSAAGEVVAFIDDDAIPAPTWLHQLAEVYAADPGAAGVGGRTFLVAPEESDSGVQFLSGLVSSLAEQDDVRWDPRAPVDSATPQSAWYPRFHGTNMSYRTSALVDLGGFDERFEYLFDDADIGVRMGQSGRRLVQLRQAVVYHVPASGRNRSAKSRYDLNWYCWLRSTVYFALKNGRSSVGLRRAVVRAAFHVSHFYTVVDDLVATGEIDPPLLRKIRRGLRRGWFEGFLTGLFGSRRIPGRLERNRRSVRWFPRPDEPPISAAALPDRHDRPAMTLERPPLRIGLLSVGYPPTSTEGVARSTETLAKGLAALGHEVHVVTSGSERRTLMRGGVYVHEIQPARRSRYAALGDDYVTVADWLSYSHAAYDEVRDLVVNHRLQVVDSPLWNLDGLVCAVADGIPVVVRVVTAMKQIVGFAHGEVPAAHRLLGDLESEFLDRTAAVVSNTEATAETLGRIYEFDTSDPRHDVVLYGIEPVAESELAGDSDDDSEDDVTVLFVGRLESRKGILDLFDAIPRVLAEHSNVRFRLAGSDNSRHDGFMDTYGTDYPEWFRRRHSELAARVEFLGYVPDEELAVLYRDCDVLVAPSLYESFGLIYLEAMNYARPVVGCRAGGPREIIVDGETGRLVPPNDGEALASAISELVVMGPSRRELGRAGRRRLLEKFTHLTMAEGFVRVYRRLVQAGLAHLETHP